MKVPVVVSGFGPFPFPFSNAGPDRGDGFIPGCGDRPNGVLPLGGAGRVEGVIPLNVPRLGDGDGVGVGP